MGDIYQLLVTLNSLPRRWGARSEGGVSRLTFKPVGTAVLAEHHRKIVLGLEGELEAFGKHAPATTLVGIQALAEP